LGAVVIQVEENRCQQDPSNQKADGENNQRNGDPASSSHGKLRTGSKTKIRD
jgi:hypothetical protein